MVATLKTARFAAPVPGTPSSAPKDLEKQKLGTAAKIQQRKRKRAAARKKSQALRAAMAEITVEPTETTATVSSAASCSSRSGAGASASGPTEHLAAATADYSHVIESRDRSDAFSTSSVTDQTVAQILTELAGCMTDEVKHHEEVEQAAGRTGKGSRKAQTTATDQSVTASAQLLSVTGLAATAERAATATILATSDTELSSDDAMCYPIYGKYYSSKQVTVTTDYATTTRTWSVARINDRRDSPLGPEYRALWVNRLLVNRRYYQRTWKPRQQLLDDDFAEELDLVDRWKASDVKSLRTSGLRTNTASVQLVPMLEAYACSLH
ncbi:hypothetical protein PInf_022792 [Phytophthora infestans]|nr:hypothetical protein PInf_022792 [Phytophthora infestans]